MLVQQNFDKWEDQNGGRAYKTLDDFLASLGRTSQTRAKKVIENQSRYWQDHQINRQNEYTKMVKEVDDERSKVFQEVSDHNKAIEGAAWQFEAEQKNQQEQFDNPLQLSPGGGGAGAGGGAGGGGAGGGGGCGFTDCFTHFESYSKPRSGGQLTNARSANASSDWFRKVMMGLDIIGTAHAEEQPEASQLDVEQVSMTQVPGPGAPWSTQVGTYNILDFGYLPTDWPTGVDSVTALLSIQNNGPYNITFAMSNANNVVEISWVNPGVDLGPEFQQPELQQMIPVAIHPHQSNQIKVVFRGKNKSDLGAFTVSADGIVRWTFFIDYLFVGPSTIPFKIDSPRLVSGLGKNFSGWYMLCTGEPPPGYLLDDVDGNLISEGDFRSCNSWAKCAMVAEVPVPAGRPPLPYTRKGGGGACFEFAVQGKEGAGLFADPDRDQYFRAWFAGHSVIKLFPTQAQVMVLK
jgi:hypothetical protein